MKKNDEDRLGMGIFSERRSPGKKQRYLTLDVLKGLGIFILIVCHHLAWVLIEGNVSGLRFAGSKEIFQWLVKIVFYLGLPFWGFFLPFLAGTTAFFYLRKENVNFRSTIKRVGVLLFLGYVVNLLAWGVYDVLAWDVLPFIALSILVSYPWVKRAKTVWGLAPLLVLGGLCLIFSQGFPLDHLGDFYLYKIIIGDSQGYNYWPFCPWYAVFSAGLWVGYLFERQRHKVIHMLPVLGCVLLVVSLTQDAITPVVNLNRIWGPVVFKPSPFYVIAVVGFGFVTIGFTERLLGRSARIKNYLQQSCVVIYGRAILWVYVFSTVLGYRMILFIDYFCMNIYQALFVLPFVTGLNLLASYGIAKWICGSQEINY